MKTFNTKLQTSLSSVALIYLYILNNTMISVSGYMLKVVRKEDKTEHINGM